MNAGVAYRDGATPVARPGAVVRIRDLGIRLSPDYAVLIERFDLMPGEAVVLDSGSGTGKSTVLGLISAAIRPTPFGGESTHVLLGVAVGPGIARLSYAGPGQIGYVLQTNPLVPYLTVGENIRLPSRLAGAHIDAEWQDHVIGVLGLGALLARRPDQVSVGQRQRAAVARAMLARPRLLLLDEPVSALDPENADQVEGLIRHLAEDAGSAVILASHQAHRGAFRQTARVAHRLERDGEGRSRSIFATAARERGQAA
ncbi:MAG: ATP-binding cassette domain-containing protein [Rhodobacteraceae bacterium]|nr:ATP-binding cassette domain-containing protein [Paracoccaceae bacterium]